jgi:hypothetical protein
MNPEHKEDCPCSCSECYLAGQSLPDWPRRKECKKLDENLKNVMESEGSPPIAEVENASNTRMLDDTKTN